MARDRNSVTEEQIASQTGSFHFLLAPFVVDVICMLRFHIVRLVEILVASYIAGVSSVRGGSKGDPCGCFLVNCLFE